MAAARQNRYGNRDATMILMGLGTGFGGCGPSLGSAVLHVRSVEFSRAKDHPVGFLQCILARSRLCKDVCTVAVLQMKTTLTGDEASQGRSYPWQLDAISYGVMQLLSAFIAASACGRVL
jgi:hypothetical protein